MHCGRQVVQRAVGCEQVVDASTSLSRGLGRGIWMQIIDRMDFILSECNGPLRYGHLV